MKPPSQKPTPWFKLERERGNEERARNFATQKIRSETLPKSLPAWPSIKNKIRKIKISTITVEEDAVKEEVVDEVEEEEKDEEKRKNLENNKNGKN